MIAPGVLVTVSVLPLVAKVALPEATVPPVGFAIATPEKQTATAIAEARSLGPDFRWNVDMPTFCVLRAGKAIK
jgi:hypothetical protein